jgi:HNH endonuclease
MIELKEFPDYFVTEDGEVFSQKTGAFLKGDSGSKTSPYLGVLLRRDGKTIRRNRHRLVAMAHLPNPHGFSEVNHKDGNKHNNVASNLEWCDRSSNMKHAYATGNWGNQYTKKEVV